MGEDRIRHKNVLLISQSFPPRIAPSSRRAGCLAKYLPEFGWRPVVLCQRWMPEISACDPQYVPGIPDQVLLEAVPVPILPRWSRGHVLEIFRRGLLPHTVPGPFLREGKRALERIFRKIRIDAIWASYPPASSHVLADWASRRWEVPWVADYRDIVNQYYQGLRSAFVVPIRIFQEKRILRTASEIIATSDGFAETMRKRLRRNILIIHNGFDPTDLAPSSSIPIKKFNIVYTGGVTHGFPDFRPLLDGLGKCINSGEIDMDHISVEFYGEGNERRLREMFSGHTYEQLVRIEGAIPWRECRKIQRNAAVLLQQTLGVNGWLTAKIFEYLAARRPILAIPADNNGIDELLHETGAGFSCTKADEISDRILKWYREWIETGTITCNGKIDLIMKYSRREQAGKLAGILAGLTGTNARNFPLEGTGQTVNTLRK
jgi:hypothetical protein